MSGRKMDLMVVIPTNAEEVRQDVMNAIDLAVAKAVPFLRDRYGRQITRGQPRDWNRNRAVQRFLNDDRGFTHMLWVDSDTTIPDNAIVDLFAIDKPVATGIQPLWMFDGLVASAKLKDIAPGDPAPWPDWISWKRPTEPFEIGFCGFGCVLVQREVFERIAEAAPPMEERQPGYGRLHPAGPWFIEDYGEWDGKDLRTEDIWFNLKCQELGIEQWCVPSVVCGHFKNVDLREWYPKKAINLTVTETTTTGG